MPTPFVGPGKLYLGDTDPATATLYCETSGNVLSDAAGVYSEVVECGTVSALGRADWELNVDMVQSGDAAGLSQYSLTNRGKVVGFYLIPSGTDPAEVSADNPAYTGQVLVQVFDIGGPSTSLATASRTWKVQGDITQVTAPPA